MSYRKCTFALAMLSLVLFPLTSAAQQPGERRQPEERQRPGERLSRLRQQTKARSDKDSELIYYLAAKIMLANEMEIQIGQMAAQETSNSEIRQFAEQIVRDHGQLNNQMKQQMPELAAMVSLNSRGQEQDQGATRNRNPGNSPQQQRRQPLSPQARQPHVNSQGKPLDGPARQLLKIAERAAQNHLDMTTQMFQQYQGQDLAMAFLGQQIAGHTWFVAELKAIQQAGPDQLQPLAQHAERLSQQHLEKAKQLAKRFEDDRRVAQPEGSPPLPEQ